MKIQLADLSRQNLPLLPQIQEIMRSLVERSAFILGPEVKAFEEAFAKYVGTKHAVGCANGTDAIYLALAALDIGPGDEVISTTYTFSATISGIMRSGARPVLIDVDDETYTLDARQIEKHITPKTKAIIPVHLYGQTADMDAVMAIAKRRRVAVVEDCAQAHGARWKGKMAGSFGAINTFSFFPSKNLSAMGDAGIVTTDDPKLARRLAALRVHGREDKFESLELGANSRLDNLQAAILSLKLPHLDRWNAERQQIAVWYRKRIDPAKYTLPVVGPNRDHVYHQFTVLTERRDALTAAFDRAGIGWGLHYPIPVHLMRGFASLGCKVGDFPISEMLCARIISLPMYPGMTEAEVDEVAKVMNAV